MDQYSADLLGDEETPRAIGRVSDGSRASYTAEDFHKFQIVEIYLGWGGWQENKR